MIWKGEEVYPGVRLFAENMKNAIMSAHDAIIASRVSQTVQANKKRTPATYKEGDLVYLSTKNITMPKGRARKLAPKYLGPFPITKVIKEGATYQLELSEELTKRGINRAFHASLLRPHVPNDDRRFPGRLPIQIPGFGEKPDEWIVDQILTHHGKGIGSEFQILWKAGDRTWASYREVAHLNALDRYCELMGVKNASELPSNYVNLESDDEEENDIITLNACMITRKDIRREDETSTLNSTHQSSLLSTTPLIHNMIYSSLSANEVRECLDFEHRLNASRLGVGPIPTNPPSKWTEFQSEQSVLASSRNSTNTPHHVTRQGPSDNVSMPAGALEAIIRAISNTSRPKPAPLPKVQYYPKYIPRPSPPTNYRGKGNHGGRGGKGKGSGNRRPKRAETTKDPRRNNLGNANPAATPVPIAGPPAIAVAGPSTTSAQVINSSDSVFDMVDFPADQESLVFGEFNDEIEGGNDSDVAMRADPEGTFMV